MVESRWYCDQLERPGADRLLVDQLGLALLQQRIGVFLRLDRGEVHRQVGQERRLRRGQREAHRVGVEHVDRCQQLVEAHVVEVVVAAAGHLVVRVGVLPLPLEREQHVLGVEVAGRLEGLVGLPLHAAAQVEGEALAVLRDVPAFGERRRDLGGARSELDQPVVDRLVGVERGARGVQHRVEVLGRAFRAIDQRLGLRGRQKGGECHGAGEGSGAVCGVHARSPRYSEDLLLSYYQSSQRQGERRTELDVALFAYPPGGQFRAANPIKRG